MSLHSRVSWKDGMFLLPQHFQQAERSLAAALHLRLGESNPLAWGILHLELNEAAIARGQLELLRCKAILPDGLVVNIPEADPGPPGRAFQLDTGGRRLEVFLTIPAHRPQMPLISPDSTRSDVRYLEQVQDTPDDHEPGRIQPIEIAAKNLRLVFSGEPLDGLVSLKIAEIERTAEGIPALRRDFVPPCLQVGAAPVLERLVRDLLGVVGARARSLTEERRARDGSTIEFNASDVLSFWFLHTLNLHAPVLRHLLDIPGTHPAQLYAELLRLAGSLATFARTDLELPPYRHEAIADSFRVLDRRIRELLGQLFTARYEVIPLVRKDVFWVGHIADAELRANGTFVLAASGDVPSSDIVAKLPHACKLSELDGIERLVRTHVGGVRLSHLSRPPSVIPVRGDTCYFTVHTEGPDWERVRVTGQLAAYVPSWLPGIKLELIGIRGGGSR